MIERQLEWEEIRIPPDAKPGEIARCEIKDTGLFLFARVVGNDGRTITVDLSDLPGALREQNRVTANKTLAVLDAGLN